MVSLLELPNELLLLISTNLKSEVDLSHLLQVNYHLYDLLLARLYQQNVKCSESQGLNVLPRKMKEACSTGGLCGCPIHAS